MSLRISGFRDLNPISFSKVPRRFVNEGGSDSRVESDSRLDLTTRVRVCESKRRSSEVKLLFFKRKK